MSTGSTVKNYPGGLDTFITYQNDIDVIPVASANDAYSQILAIETELGTDPAGSMTDVKSRLAVSLNNDGTIKDGAVQIGQITKMQKKTITVSASNGTFAFDFTDQGLVDYVDADYQVFLTTNGTNGANCWAAVSGSKATTGFTIALLTADATGRIQYDASSANVTVDVLTIHS